jgi:hypothetical protein
VLDRRPSIAATSSVANPAQSRKTTH